MRPLHISLLAILFVSGAAFTNTASAFTMCIEEERYAPWLYAANDLPANGRDGVLIDIVRKGAAKMNHAVTLERRPWKRCLSGLQRNIFDTAIASVYLPERETFARYPKRDGKLAVDLRLMRVDYPLFMRPNPGWAFDGQHFSRPDLVIGVPLGYAVHQVLADMGARPVDRFFPRKGLALVASGKIDAYVVERRTGQAILAHAGITGVLATKAAVYEADWYMLMSHHFHDQVPALAMALWENIAEYSRTHRDAILKEYVSLEKAARAR